LQGLPPTLARGVYRTALQAQDCPGGTRDAKHHQYASDKTHFPSLAWLGLIVFNWFDFL
jgi:hypothetical protein